MTKTDKTLKFPIGSRVKLQELDKDPYPVYSQLREKEPISWVPDLNMWFVTRREDIRDILKNPELFTTYSKHSTIFDTFDAHMLTVDGDDQTRFKSACRTPFLPKSIQDKLVPEIRKHANGLIDEFIQHGAANLQEVFSARLPVQTMLTVFGLAAEYESELRTWYDDFEQALANFKWDQGIRGRAKKSVSQFADLLQENIEKVQKHPDGSLLSSLANAPADRRLTDDEIKRNSYIIFFGGISTVEALISNTIWSLLSHPDIFERVQRDKSLVLAAVEETLRWHSPVQSCTRHVTRDVEYAGIKFEQGDTVNCMLGSANRDPEHFTNPDEFNIDRVNAGDHMAFGYSVHFCLGAPLARAEGAIAIETILDRLTGISLDTNNSSQPFGSEFHKLPTLYVSWNRPA